jgi:6-phosphogluconolactonase (cycloisomerase 2 family)
VDPNGGFYWVADENDIPAFSVDSNGNLTANNDVYDPTLRSGWECMGVDPSGSYVYACSAFRGVDVYRVDAASGALTLVGSAPRNRRNGGGSIAVDPSGKFAYITDDGAYGSIAIYTIQLTNGMLIPAGTIQFPDGTLSPGGIAIARTVQ